MNVTFDRLYLLSKNSLIISLEFCDSGICKRMMCHLFNYFIRYRCDICTCKCTVSYMDRITYTCCNDLCINITCYGENLCNLADQICSTYRNIIQTSKERRNICSSCSCRKKCLKALQAFRPSTVIGIFTTIFG